MPYETGRPPRRHPAQWESRGPSAVRYSERFKELESSEGEDGQGVYLGQNSYAARTRGQFAGDELYFDGYDLGQDAQQQRRQLYDEREFDGYDSAEEEHRRGVAYQVPVGRDREDALVQTALERIAKARARGKTNINFPLDEMEALERRRAQQPEPAATLASPPATPAKSKGKAGSKTGSSSSLSAQKTRKKASSISSPAKSNSKAKVARKSSAEQAVSYPGSGTPGIMVPGPNGVPVYTPIVYGPPSLEHLPSQSGTKPRSRSSSKHSRRESTPERNTEQAYASYSPRYHPSSSGVRPPSSSSNRSFQDDVDWYPPTPRHRSASNAQTYTAYRPDEHDGVPLMPAAQGRRNVSDPATVRYSQLRRAPPSSSPLAPRPVAQHASHSDPAFRKPVSGLGREMEDTRRSGSRSGSDSSDDQGVQVDVDIVPGPGGSGGGYEIKRVPVPAHVPTAVSGNESRKRRGGRR